ncbi:MAG TPA: LapA family protein [Sphingomicrobium sp.]|nr:LapA family protein [Sphingomicrobium sp.]
MVAFTSDQWVILALVFVLGLLIGAFILAGSGRKWKTRFREQEQRTDELEARQIEREREWEEREKEWRERDSLRGAALKDKDSDGVPDKDE